MSTMNIMHNLGRFCVVGTPIGNLADISRRAIEILTQAEIVVCEDTRVTHKLLTQLSRISEAPSRSRGLFRLDEHVQMRMIPKVLHWLATGTDVALVTDAGMPCISDPGWKVVDAVREAGFAVEIVPGPSALDTAIAASGMDASRVWFGGFLPKKDTHQRAMVDHITNQLESGFITMAVVFESPKRLKETIGLFLPSGRVKMAACGELTKTHEKVIRGSAAEVLERLPLEIKGEWVVVIGL